MASRNHSIDSSPRGWYVYRNKVLIGELTHREFRAIERAAYRNPRNAIALIGALVAASSRTIFATLHGFLVLTPVLIFWMGIVVALISPQSYTDLLRAIAAENPQTLAHKVVRLAVVPGILSMLLALSRELLRLDSATSSYQTDVCRQISERFNLDGMDKLSLERKPIH